MSKLPLLFILSLAITAYSCGGNGGGDDEVVTQQENDPTEGSGAAQLVYDSELSPQERQALDSSTGALSSLAIDGNKIRGFREVFGGDRSSNVVNFFERRVNYAISGSTDINSRIVADPTEPIPPGLYAVETLATNIGAALWIGSAVTGTGTVDFLINDNVVSINSSRVGIMQFGNIFPQRETVQQVNTLVHEARHSDCTGGIKAEDLRRFRAGQFPKNKKCGHFHVVCPLGHPLEGEFACDSHPWGAYVVGAIHSLAVARACPTCSETDKTIAELEALDSLSRLLYDTEDMLEGKLGPADMSSSNNVEE